MALNEARFIKKPTIKTKKKLPTFSKWDIAHGALDVAGLVPLIGEPADLINAVLYGVRGKKTESLLSLAGAIPILGHIVTGGKIGRKAGQSYIKHTAKVIKESAPKKKYFKTGYSKTSSVSKKPTKQWTETEINKDALERAAKSEAELSAKVAKGEIIKSGGSKYWTISRGVSKKTEKGFEIDFFRDMIQFRKYKKGKWVAAKKGQKGAKPFLVGGGKNVDEWGKMKDVLNFASLSGEAASYPGKSALGTRVLQLNVSKKFIKRFAHGAEEFTGSPLKKKSIEGRRLATEMESHFEFPSGIDLEELVQGGHLHDIKLWDTVIQNTGQRQLKSPFFKPTLKKDLFENLGKEMIEGYIKSY